MNNTPETLVNAFEAEMKLKLTAEEPVGAAPFCTQKLEAMQVLAQMHPQVRTAVVEALERVEALCASTDVPLADAVRVVRERLLNHVAVV